MMPSNWLFRRVDVPNLFSLGNGACGLAAGVVAYLQPGPMMWLLVVASLLLDGADGWLARRIPRGPGGRHGHRIDLAADAVSYGLAPAALVAANCWLGLVAAPLFVLSVAARLWPQRSTPASAWPGLPSNLGACIVWLAWAAFGSGWATTVVCMAVAVAMQAPWWFGRPRGLRAWTLAPMGVAASVVAVAIAAGGNRAWPLAGLGACSVIAAVGFAWGKEQGNKPRWVMATAAQHTGSNGRSSPKHSIKYVPFTRFPKKW